ncbi:hypothetical protein SDC9_124004 [bioreactor metagenome]|uniref:Uncharacterized protein n=1 Tax=bioreactor metagenome TaxID=1076179 RepID=A0A645CJ84_9ZZZZ
MPLRGILCQGARTHDFDVVRVRTNRQNIHMYLLLNLLIPVFHVFFRDDDNTKDQSFHHLLHVCLKAEHAHRVVDDVHEHNAPERLDRAALAAGERRSADDDHRDDVERTVEREVAGCAEHARHHHDSAERREEPLHDEYAPKMPAHMQAEVVRHVDVAADDIEVSAILCLRQHIMRGQRNQQEEEEGDRHRPDHYFADGKQRRMHVGNRRRAGNRQRNPFVSQLHRHGDDERRQAEGCDEKSGDRPAHAAENERQQHRRHKPDGRQRHHKHACRQGHHRAHRDIQLTAEQDKGKPDCHDAVSGNALKQPRHVDRLKEVFVGQAHDHEDGEREQGNSGIRKDLFCFYHASHLRFSLSRQMASSRTAPFTIYCTTESTPVRLRMLVIRP